MTGFSNQTLRQIARVSIGGSELRLRLSNTFGTKAVSVGAVQVGLRDKGRIDRSGLESHGYVKHVEVGHAVARRSDRERRGQA